MATPKIILYKHKTYSDGSHPIIIQIIKNGKAIRKVIAKCKEKDWLITKQRVSTKHNEAPRINNEIEIALRDFGMPKGTSFYSLFQRQIDNFKIKNQVSRFNINQNVLKGLKSFAPNADFDDVTESFIYKFASYLKLQGNGPGTIKEKMNVFGAIMKLAKKQKLITDNPFEYVEFARHKAVKSKLSIEEIQKLINADLPDKQDEARDIFLACIYLRGIRVGDVLTLKKSNIVDGRLHYKERKTDKSYNVGIIPELAAIFEKWQGKNRHGYIFRLLEVPSDADPFVFSSGIKNAIAKLIQRLKAITKKIGIDKKVTTHTARHSFSKLANEVIKNTSITRDLVGHSSLSIHESYINDISDDIVMDNYAEQILDKIKVKTDRDIG